MMEYMENAEIKTKNDIRIRPLEFEETDVLNEFCYLAILS